MGSKLTICGTWPRKNALKYFLDCEFNGFCGQLISLALVREDAEAVYYVFDQPDAPDPFVAKHVLPVLWACPFEPRAWTKDEASRDLGRFLAGDETPLVVSDWPEDVSHFLALVVVGPGRMIPLPRLDFSIAPLSTFPTSLPNAVQHNAWWDAMALRRRHEELAR